MGWFHATSIPQVNKDPIYLISILMHTNHTVLKPQKPVEASLAVTAGLQEVAFEARCFLLQEAGHLGRQP